MSKDKCDHTTIIKNLCTSCGVLIKDNVESLKADGRVALLHNVPDLLVAKDLANEIGNSERERLLKSKKLILIVDLDQTIIHSSTIYVRDMKMIDKKDHQAMIDDVIDIDKDKYLCHTHKSYFQYTFFRKNVREFFQHLEPYFEFHVFTMGTRDYAEPIINYLDPEGKWFGSRIKTRNEFQIENNKYIELKSIFPCTSDLVCILDDRLDVWCHSDNVLQIYPFESEHALALYEKFNGKFIKQLFISGGGIVDENTILRDYSDLLRRIHNNFFDQITTTSSLCTKEIMHWFRKSIFCRRYKFYVDTKFLKPSTDERINNLICRVRIIGGRIVAESLLLECCEKNVTYIVVDKTIHPSSEYRKAIEDILRCKSKSNIKFIRAKWIDMCYFQWRYVNEKAYVVDADQFIKNNLVSSSNSKNVGKRELVCAENPNTDHLNICAKKTLKTTETAHSHTDNDSVYLTISNNDEFSMDNEVSEESDKIDRLNLVDNEEENIKKFDENKIDLKKQNNQKNNEKFSSKYYNKDDIKSMADELESFLE